MASNRWSNPKHTRGTPITVPTEASRDIVRFKSYIYRRGSFLGELLRDPSLAHEPQRPAGVNGGRHPVEAGETLLGVGRLAFPDMVVQVEAPPPTSTIRDRWPSLA
jgi:hypothetical protein